MKKKFIQPQLMTAELSPADSVMGLALLSAEPTAVKFVVDESTGGEYSIWKGKK